MRRSPLSVPAAWTRFRVGSLVGTVVSDGRLEMGPAATNFPGADPAEIAALMTDHYLDPENVVLDQNLLVLDDGERLVLFDTGTGADPGLGRKVFGPRTGQAVDNLRAAGIDPAEIDIVALTHAHPDHCWGLLDASGKRLYPNARLAINPLEAEFWNDLGKVAGAPNELAADHFVGAHKNLTPYADQMMDVFDGTELIPGVRALATPGHSPYHMAYEISSGGEKMILWGDLCHHEVLLLRRPDWNFQFDFDKAEARAQRQRIFRHVLNSRSQVLAYHFPFPGRGHLRRNAAGECEWVPIRLDT